MTHHHSPWWMVAAGACAVAATVAPAAVASAADDTFVIEMDDAPDKIRLGETITYTFEVTNSGYANYLIVMSWDPATLVDFVAPTDWHVNLPPSVSPTAISTFYNPDGNTNTVEPWTGTVTFTLVVEPSSPGPFDAYGTVFDDLPGEDTDHERTIVRGARRAG